MSIEKRVARGADLLDEIYPGWENRISLRQLDIGCSFGCIIGQLYGQFTRYSVEEKIGVRLWSTPKYGFADHVYTTRYSSKIRQWEKLTDEWRRVIMARHKKQRELREQETLEREHRRLLREASRELVH